jgi:hypothetical protein
VFRNDGDFASVFTEVFPVNMQATKLMPHDNGNWKQKLILVHGKWVFSVVQGTKLCTYLYVALALCLII